MKNLKIAILYQVQSPPVVNGIIKPMKPGGYSDSGADIAFTLKQRGISVITPVNNPDIKNDVEWVFPDTRKGIETALSKGVEVLWLNTVLYKAHPIIEFMERGIYVVGQNPENVEVFDDKWITNELLRKNRLPVPPSFLINRENLNLFKDNYTYPVILKPIRGRGSQGVKKVDNWVELYEEVYRILEANTFGDSLYLEKYLPGKEVTLTVMPPGEYLIQGKLIQRNNYWSLSPVERLNHNQGIAPYNGVVAVINNSELMDEKEIDTPRILKLKKECEIAAGLVQAKAPVRIDCRADENGNYYLFDLNMKPNMTGAGRPGREDQDSLTTLTARGIGWSYFDLLFNMLQQNWNIQDR